MHIVWDETDRQSPRIDTIFGNQRAADEHIAWSLAQNPEVRLRYERHFLKCSPRQKGLTAADRRTL